MAEERAKPIRRTSCSSGNYRPTKCWCGYDKKRRFAYRRKNPGSKLKTAVTGKVKKGVLTCKRRKSYCARSGWSVKKK